MQFHNITNDSYKKAPNEKKVLVASDKNKYFLGMER